MKYATPIAALLVLLLASGCVSVPSDRAVGCWETKPNSNGESLAMHFAADGTYYYPVQIGKPDSSGGRMILINRNAKGSWERINETAVKVYYQENDPVSGEDIVAVDTVVFENSGDSAYFVSTGQSAGLFYKSNQSCD